MTLGGELEAGRVAKLRSCVVPAVIRPKHPGTSCHGSGRGVGERPLGQSARPCSANGIETAIFVVAGSRSRRSRNCHLLVVRRGSISECAILPHSGTIVDAPSAHRDAWRPARDVFPGAPGLSRGLTSAVTPAPGAKLRFGGREVTAAEIVTLHLEPGLAAWVRSIAPAHSREIEAALDRLRKELNPASF